MTDGNSATTTAELIQTAIRKRLHPHTDVTQGELASRLDTDRTTVNRLLCGQMILTVPWLDRIALALGCSVSDLVPADADADADDEAVA